MELKKYKKKINGMKKFIMIAKEVTIAFQDFVQILKGRLEPQLTKKDKQVIDKLSTAFTKTSLLYKFLNKLLFILYNITTLLNYLEKLFTKKEKKEEKKNDR